MKKKYETMPLDEQVIFPIYLCSKELIRKYNSLLDKYGLTYTQFVIMMYLWDKKTSNVKKISETMLLDSSTLTPLLKKLEKKGYIARNKSLMDERNLSIELTKEGKELEEKTSHVPLKMEEICALNKEEVNNLRSAVTKLLTRIIEENKNENN